MSNKQTSLFDFDELPEDKRVEEVLPVVVLKEILTIVNEEPVEINFIAATENTPVKEEPRELKRGRRKLTEPLITADLIDVPEDEILFQKKILQHRYCCGNV